MYSTNEYVGHSETLLLFTPNCLLLILLLLHYYNAKDKAIHNWSVQQPGG